MDTTRPRVGPPCTRDQRPAASLDTVRHEQRSLEKQGHIYRTGSSTKGTHEAHRFPCCSARYRYPPNKLQRTRETGLPVPPAQIPACGFPAPGSCRRSNATEVRGLGGPFTSSPQARSFSDTPYPARSPGHASPLTFPSTGRLPSTISAADLRSALFEASQVLCSRPTPHLSRDGFVSSTSRRVPAPPEQ